MTSDSQTVPGTIPPFLSSPGVKTPQFKGISCFVLHSEAGEEGILHLFQVVPWGTFKPLKSAGLHQFLKPVSLLLVRVALVSG